MQRLQSYHGQPLSLLCLRGHGVQRVFYVVLSSERVRESVRAPWVTVNTSKYVLGCACQRKAGV